MKERTSPVPSLASTIPTLLLFCAGRINWQPHTCGWPSALCLNAATLPDTHNVRTHHLNIGTNGSFQSIIRWHFQWNVDTLFSLAHCCSEKSENCLFSNGHDIRKVQKCTTWKIRTEKSYKFSVEKDLLFGRSTVTISNEQETQHCTTVLVFCQQKNKNLNRKMCLVTDHSDF